MQQVGAWGDGVIRVLVPVIDDPTRTETQPVTGQRQPDGSIALTSTVVADTSTGYLTSGPVAQPTVSTTAYAVGQQVGGLLQFAALDAVLRGVIVQSTSLQTCAFYLHLFSGAPTHSTFLDGTVPDIASADVPLWVAAILLDSYVSLGDATLWRLDTELVLPATAPLYGILVLTDTVAPTFTTASDLRIYLITSSGG